MSYKTWFTKDDWSCSYSGSRAEHKVELRGYFLKPAQLLQDQVKRYDESAARLISEMQEEIAALIEYRRALAARYAELETQAYKTTLKLAREPHYKGAIYYYVTITRRYEDGTEAVELNERYTGKDRKKAFDRFAELKKQRPGIEIMKDIEKRQWER